VTSGSTELAKGALGSDLTFLRLERVDGQVQLLLGDQVESWPIPNFDPELPTKSIAPKIRFRGQSDFPFERLRVLRDIYYVNTGHDFLSGPDQSYKVRSGEYFAMGDNSYFSYDSRDWGPVRAEKLIGKALVVLFPPSRAKFIY
jgi:signal peptidase I